MLSFRSATSSGRARMIRTNAKTALNATARKAADSLRLSRANTKTKKD
jgi:hypothetical protein